MILWSTFNVFSSGFQGMLACKGGVDELFCHYYLPV